MTPKSMQHVVVYKDDQYFSAWPFNGGFWQFADGELAVGFVRGKVDYRDPKTVGHQQVDADRGEHVILRSRDGGRTWPIETLTTVYTRPALDEQVKKLPSSVASDQRFDPRADGYCLLGVFGIPPPGAAHLACVFISTDRGHTWSAPLRLPSCKIPTLGGRPSYVVRPDGRVLLFGHGERQAGSDPSLPRQAIPLIWASWDGGASWGLLGEMELTPAQPMGIMPYPIYLRDGTLLAAVRRQYDGYNAYTQVYRSQDEGRTWQFLSRVNDWGAPASLTELPDGRVVCVYGYRQKPWGIRARVSLDHGQRWGEEIVLRDDGACWDLGYPRTHLRADGSLVSVYYFTDRDARFPETLGVRHIAATLWEV